MMDRIDILARHRARKDARLALTNGIKEKRETWRPANIADRWKSKQIEKLSGAKDKSLQIAKDNKRLLGGAALAAILLAAHRPILDAAKRWNSGTGKGTGDE
ncbi:hypothetical protein ACFOWX_06325 [Sphingorhabdus arenilitoris]|uniref:DUF3618 domain-containing protein n=1 Tax=Sphingorhabdus arenilitoris TaxID=1490041 RepID=A0ABV8RFR7_9SPHN